MNSTVTLGEYNRAGLVCAPLNYIQIVKNLRLYAQYFIFNARVVAKTANVVILRCCLAEQRVELL